MIYDKKKQKFSYEQIFLELPMNYPSPKKEKKEKEVNYIVIDLNNDENSSIKL